MTRRESIRSGILFAMALALGKMDTLKASGGQLTCPLDQWDHVTFTYRGKTVTISVNEIFRSLQEGIDGFRAAGPKAS